MQRVLLLAAIDSIGIARVPRLLARSGYEVSLLAPQKLAVRRSRFVHSHYRAELSPVAVVKAATAHLAEHAGRYDWVVFGDEPTLWAAVDEPGMHLREFFPFPLEKLPVLSSKVEFLSQAAKANLPLPPSEASEDGSEVFKIANRIGYPLLIKPERGLAGSGLKFATDDAALRAQITTALPAPYVVQQAIPGEPGSTSVLYDHGRPLCWVSYLMRNTWPNRFASACVAEIFDHSDVETLVRGAGQITGFHGLAGIDWMRDERTNRLLLLELNPRPTPTYHLGSHAGVDFAASLASVRTGKPLVQRPAPASASIALFPQNLYRAVDVGSAGEFLKSFRDAPYRDPALLLSYLRRWATHYLPASLRHHAKQPAAAEVYRGSA